jgi:hypothetical protein
VQKKVSLIYDNLVFGLTILILLLLIVNLIIGENAKSELYGSSFFFMLILLAIDRELQSLKKTPTTPSIVSSKNNLPQELSERVNGGLLNDIGNISIPIDSTARYREDISPFQLSILCRAIGSLLRFKLANNSRHVFILMCMISSPTVCGAGTTLANSA